MDTSGEEEYKPEEGRRLGVGVMDNVAVDHAAYGAGTSGGWQVLGELQEN